MGRRAEGEAAAPSRGVGGGRAVGDKAGERWCLVRSLCDRSLDFLTQTPRQEQLPQNAGGTRREEARRARGGDGHEKGEQTEALSARRHQTHLQP